jgi:hypothetical protein
MLLAGLCRRQRASVVGPLSGKHCIAGSTCSMRCGLLFRQAKVFSSGPGRLRMARTCCARCEKWDTGPDSEIFDLPAPPDRVRGRGNGHPGLRMECRKLFQLLIHTLKSGETARITCFPIGRRPFDANVEQSGSALLYREPFPDKC